MTRDSLTHRVGELLRGERHLPASLSEREVQAALRPDRHQVIAVAPASAPQVIRLPLTNARPTGPGNLGGARGELPLDRGDSTG